MGRVNGLLFEIESLERYEHVLRKQIISAQRELARVTRKKQQLLVELSRLKKQKVMTG